MNFLHRNILMISLNCNNFLRRVIFVSANFFDIIESIFIFNNLYLQGITFIFLLPPQCNKVKYLEGHKTQSHILWAKWKRLQCNNSCRRRKKNHIKFLFAFFFISFVKENHTQKMFLFTSILSFFSEIFHFKISSFLFPSFLPNLEA
jgi:hypothetical protein